MRKHLNVYYAKFACLMILLYCCANTANANNEIHANELSSVQWRNCAGYSYLVYRSHLIGSDHQKEAQYARKIGHLLLIAAEIKAQDERQTGRSGNSLGQSLFSVYDENKLDEIGSSYANRLQQEIEYEEDITYYSQLCKTPILKFKKRYDDYQAKLLRERINTLSGGKSKAAPADQPRDKQSQQFMDSISDWHNKGK